MFNKKTPGFIENVETLIGINTVISGNIETEGTIRIDGKINGDVSTNGDAFIGSGSIITGNVKAFNVTLAGMVEGNITAKGILKLLTTAKLFGDIRVNSLLADEGAMFQGKCDMVETPEEEKFQVKPFKASKKDRKKIVSVDEAN